MALTAFVTDEIDRLIKGLSSNAASLEINMMCPYMRCDLTESDDCYEITCDVPGITGTKISVEGNSLTISGSRVVEKTSKSESGKTYISQERYRGEFKRTFNMPSDAVMKGTKGMCVNGVLTVTVPRGKRESFTIDIENAFEKVDVEQNSSK